MTGRLDLIVARQDPWKARAACRTPRARQLVADGKANFFPEPGRSAGAARDICADCPVRTECLEDALADDGGKWRHGIFGGLTRAQRRRIVDQRESAA